MAHQDDSGEDCYYVHADLLHMVFSSLDTVALSRAAFMCKEWKEIAACEDFWKCLSIQNQAISPQQFENICRRHPNVTAVHIYNTGLIDVLGMRAMDMLGNLETLTIGKGHISLAFFKSLTNCQTLRSLTINDTSLGKNEHEISIHNDMLHHCEINKCRLLSLYIRCPQLKTLSLKQSDVPHVTLDCPLLHDLNLSDCPHITETSLASISFTCPNLHILDAFYCRRISLQLARLSKLTVLKLHGCEGITSASMVALSRHSTILEDLELDNCSFLTSIILELSFLQSIRLVNCCRLISVTLTSTNALSSITISNCASLESISIESDALKKLTLQKQQSLRSVKLICCGLQELDLIACESSTVSLPPRPLSNEGIQVIEFYSKSLLSLFLGGCRAINSLDFGPCFKNVLLRCPCLEDGCDKCQIAAVAHEFCPIVNEVLEMVIVLSLELNGGGCFAKAMIVPPLNSFRCISLKHRPFFKSDDFISSVFWCPRQICNNARDT
ncbi:putative F-box/LRR-repeat protein [Salvia divinorum]|uniref:F-box/LRR-repeat protein n=1 Tax=Salvia divinorum TaxID=28513 RepID=A0ABD1I0R7_SALDI